MARFASARILLALAAVAALSLAGCGGGGSDDGASGTASSEAQGAGTTTTSSAKAKGSSSGSASKDSTDSENPAAPSGSPGAQGKGKQGKPIQLPAGEPEPTATPAEEAKATVADILLTSPSLGASESVATLPATYTCEGKDTWPALEWRGIPADTEELILFAMNVAPVQGKLFFDWAVAGLPANLSGLEEGQLPKGAVVGQNSFGKTNYEICPPQGQAETYIFALHAIPKRLAPSKGFDPHRLREEALAAVGRAGILAVSFGR